MPGSQAFATSASQSICPVSRKLSSIAYDCCVRSWFTSTGGWFDPRVPRLVPGPLELGSRVARRKRGYFLRRILRLLDSEALRRWLGENRLRHGLHDRREGRSRRGCIRREPWPRRGPASRPVRPGTLPGHRTLGEPGPRTRPPATRALRRAQQIPRSCSRDLIAPMPPGSYAQKRDGLARQLAREAEVVDRELHRAAHAPVVFGRGQEHARGVLDRFLEAIQGFRGCAPEDRAGRGPAPRG